MLSFAKFVSPSQRCYLLRNLCPPVSAVVFCAICVVQLALFSFAQFVSPSQRCCLLHNLCPPVSAVIFCTICIPPASAVVFCVICVAQSALLSFAQFVSPQSAQLSFTQFVSLQSALLSFAQFVSPSQRFSFLRNLCPPVSPGIFCTIYVAQSALFVFVPSVSRSQRPPICSLINSSIQNYVPMLCGYLRSLLNKPCTIILENNLCNIYRVTQEECARLREGVPYVKVYRYNPKHLCPKLNGYGDNDQRSLKL